MSCRQDGMAGFSTRSGSSRTSTASGTRPEAWSIGTASTARADRSHRSGPTGSTAPASGARWPITNRPTASWSDFSSSPATSARRTSRPYTNAPPSWRCRSRPAAATSRSRSSRLDKAARPFYSGGMRHLVLAALVSLVAISAGSDVLAKGKPIQNRREPDMCAVPPGAQPLLPAQLLPGMGVTKNFPVTTTSEEARQFFLQGVSQIHSFWFTESERSCLQALQYDPNMAMAHWCIALSAAGDYRPAFQLLRSPSNGGRTALPNADAVARTTNGAAVDPQVRAREA